MGNCSDTNELEPRHIFVNQRNQQIKNNNNNNINFEINMNQNLPDINTDQFLDSEFKNFPSENNIYSGEGIKRMKAYKSKIQVDKLGELRDKFFISKIKAEGEIWKQIRYACFYDHEKALNLINAYHLTPYKNCMNVLIDSRGKRYYTPNFCINDPYICRDEIKVSNSRKAVEINLKFVEIYTNKKKDLKVLDDISVLKLKQLYHPGLNDPKLMRMITSGQELMDNNLLYQHEIKNEQTINVIIKS